MVSKKIVLSEIADETIFTPKMVKNILILRMFVQLNFLREIIRPKY